MIFKSLKIPDLIIIKPKIINDKRGYFYESYRLNIFKKKIGNYAFVQENESFSNLNTLRGLHIQLKNTQGKLIKVLEGKIYDVCLDLRSKSKYYGKYCSILLNAKNKNLLWVPPGFAHGFLVLTDNAKIEYKCTDYYNSNSEISINPFDKALNIKWPSKNSFDFSLSQKDKLGISFNDFDKKYSTKIKQ